MNIMDLAEAIAPECKTEVVGIRSGEKIHEVLITKDNALQTLEYDNYYVVQPIFRYFKRRFKNNGGSPVSKDYEYNSRTNPWFLTIDEMREMIKT